MPRIEKEDCLQYIDEYIFQYSSAEYTMNHSQWPGAVGIELEMLPVFKQGHKSEKSITDKPVPISRHDSAEILQRVIEENGWETVKEQVDSLTLITLIILNGKGSISFEPGGQIEFSSRPYLCLSEVLKKTNEIQAQLDSIFSQQGAEFVQTGINPWHTPEEIGLQIPKKRYKAMDKYFQQLSSYGRRMMRQTCTIQVCLDFGRDEDIMAKRFLTSQLLAPFAGAIFANSPIVDGEVTENLGNRSIIWMEMDSKETRFPSIENIIKKMSKKSCVDSYLDFALASNVIFIEELDYKVLEKPITFAEWMQNGVMNVFPTLKDFIIHLSLLFPEVRPKGFIELRSVDCQTRAFQFLPAVFYTSILYDNQSLDSACNLLLRYEKDLLSLLHKSRFALKDDELFTAAKQLMSIAVDGFHRLPLCFREEVEENSLEKFADSYTYQRRVPSHEILDYVTKHPNIQLSVSHLNEIDEHCRKMIN